VKRRDIPIFSARINLYGCHFAVIGFELPVMKKDGNFERFNSEQQEAKKHGVTLIHILSELQHTHSRPKLKIRTRNHFKNIYLIIFSFDILNC
jgi:hypothetical protein